MKSPAPLTRRALLGLAFGTLACASSQKTTEVPVAATSSEALARSHAVTIACVGEQTTHSAHRENDPEYPERLSLLLAAQHGNEYAVHNFGLPKGRILVEGPAAETEAYLGSEVFEQSRQMHPDVVVLGPWGRHDTYEGNWPEWKASFPTDLERLARAYLELEHPPVVFVVTPLPYNGGTDHPITELLEPTRELAARLSLPVIDLWEAFLGQPQLYKDGTHLLPDGQQLHARVVAEALIAHFAE